MRVRVKVRVGVGGNVRGRVRGRLVFWVVIRVTKARHFGEELGKLFELYSNVNSSVQGLVLFFVESQQKIT